MNEPLDPNETNPYLLWAEIARLQVAVQGPAGFDTWMEAAVHERRARIEAERRLQTLEDKLRELLSS
jgi:hypothetical protein